MSPRDGQPSPAHAHHAHHDDTRRQRRQRDEEDSLCFCGGARSDLDRRRTGTTHQRLTTDLHYGLNTTNNYSRSGLQNEDERSIGQRYVASCLDVSPFRILCWTVRRAVAPGDNFASTLLRVRAMVAGRERPVSFMVKCLPDGLMRRIVQEVGMWRKEKAVYRAIVPLIHRLVGHRVAPKCLRSPNPTDICLEDLRESGYVMVDRRKQLDLEHCKVALHTLARFHAGSVAVKELSLEADMFALAGEELCFKESKKESAHEFLKAPFVRLADYLESDEDLRRYAAGVRDFGERFFDLAVEGSKPRSEFNVLNHGDFWTNNILFRYDERTGRVQKAKVVDFQNCRYTTPAHDLQYFIMSSAAEEVRETRTDELVASYLESLNGYLGRLGLRTLPEEVLRRDLEAMEWYAFYSATSVLATVINDPEEFSSEDLDFSENPFVKCMQGERYRKMIPKILKRFERKGIF